MDWDITRRFVGKSLTQPAGIEQIFRGEAGAAKVHQVAGKPRARHGGPRVRFVHLREAAEIDDVLSRFDDGARGLLGRQAPSGKLGRQLRRGSRKIVLDESCRGRRRVAVQLQLPRVRRVRQPIAIERIDHRINAAPGGR